MRKFVKPTLLFVVSAIVVSFQGCSGCQSQKVAFEGEGDTTQAASGSGDGRPITGKPGEGIYFRQVPGYACGGQARIHSSIEVSEERIALNTLNERDCSTTTAEIQVAEVESTYLSQELLTFGSAVYEKKEVEPSPEAIDQPVVEAYCRLQAPEHDIEIVVRNLGSEGRVESVVKGGSPTNGVWAPSASETHDLSRESRSGKLVYLAQGLSLSIDRAAASSGLFPGDVQLIYNGASISGQAECRTGGWHDQVAQVQPNFSLGFAGGVLPPSVTYSRLGAGTYFDSNGAIQVASANVPRFDHHPVSKESLGILLEETRTNLALDSTDLASAKWDTMHMRVVKEGTLAGLDRFRIEKNDPGNLEFWWRTNQWVDNILAGVTYTASFLAQAGNINSANVIIWEAANNEATVSFDLVNGTYTVGYQNIISVQSAAMVPVAGGYRVSVSFIASTTGDVSIGIGPNSTRLGDFVYATAAQLERGPSASSVILTTATAVTRGEDNLSVSDVSWFNPGSGTLQANLSRIGLEAGDPAAQALSIGNSAGDFYALQFDPATTYGARLEYRGQAVGWDASSPALSGPSARQAISLAYASGDSALALNGSLSRGPANAPTGMVPEHLKIGGPSGSKWNGHLHSFVYWPNRLTDDFLVRLGN